MQISAWDKELFTETPTLQKCKSETRFITLSNNQCQ